MNITFFFFFCACSVKLVEFRNQLDDEVTITGRNMFKLLGHCEMMDAEIMDYIISYWKGDPDMKYMFESGERVLLGPYFIPVCFLSLVSTRNNRFPFFTIFYF